MEEQITLFEVLRIILLWLSPAIFMVGLYLIFIKEEKHHKLEKALGKEMGGLKKKLVPVIEKDIDILHKWLLKKRIMLGLFLLVYSVMLFTVLRQ